MTTPSNSARGPLLPLPVEPAVSQRWLYAWCTSGWHRIGYGVLALLGVAAVIWAAWLLGLFADRHHAVPDAATALPAEEFPEMEAGAAAGLNSQDGDDSTLTVPQLRYLLEQIDANAAKVASGAEPDTLGGSRPTAEELASAETPEITRAYWQWVDDHACPVSGWSGQSGRNIALLVRNGVWQCSGFRQWMAGLPLAEWLGTWLALLGALVLGALPWPLLWHAWRKIRHIGRLHRLNAHLHGSWMR